MHFVGKALSALQALHCVCQFKLFVITVAWFYFATPSLCAEDVTSLTLKNDRVAVWVAINLSETKNFVVTVPATVTANSSLHVQFNSSINIDDRSTFIRHGLPSILLSTWLDSPPPSPIEQDMDEKKVCSKFDPCIETAENSSVDGVALLNNLNYAYARLDDLVSRKGKQINISISNYDRLSRQGPEPVLKGVLHVRFVTDSLESCPMTISLGNEAEPVLGESVCNERGNCVDGMCQCVAQDEYYGGRACEQPVIQWLNQSSFVIPKETNTAFGKFSIVSIELQRPELPAIFVTAPIFSSLLFRIEASKEENKNDLYLFVASISNLSLDASDNQLKNLTSRFPQMYFYPGENNASQQGDIIFGNFSRASTRELSPWEEWNDSHSSLSKIIKTKGNDPFYLSVLSNASFLSERALTDVSFVLLRGHCPNVSCSASIHIPFALLPISLVIMSLAIVAIVTLLCLDRRLRAKKKGDKLTSDELQRMYPSSPFSGNSSRYGLNSADSGDNNITCSICLCHFSNGEQIREFRCRHIFHAECVDPWLINNQATCPTCRGNVRIKELSDNRFAQNIKMFFTRPISNFRRWQDRRRQHIQDEVEV